MPIIHLGNTQAVHHVVGASGEVERTPLDGEQVTEINLPDGVYTLREQLRTIVHRDGIWPAHSDADRPSWVHCSDPVLEAALMDHWGCRAGGPDDFMDRVDELHRASDFASSSEVESGAAWPPVVVASAITAVVAATGAVVSGPASGTAGMVSGPASGVSGVVTAPASLRGPSRSTRRSPSERAWCSQRYVTMRGNP